MPTFLFSPIFAYRVANLLCSDVVGLQRWTDFPVVAMENAISGAEGPILAVTNSTTVITYLTGSEPGPVLPIVKQIEGTQMGSGDRMGAGTCRHPKKRESRRSGQGGGNGGTFRVTDHRHTGMGEAEDRTVDSRLDAFWCNGRLTQWKTKNFRTLIRVYPAYRPCTLCEVGKEEVRASTNITRHILVWSRQARWSASSTTH